MRNFGLTFGLGSGATWAGISIGSSLLPVYGTIIGGLAGAAIGAFSGSMVNYGIDSYSKNKKIR